MLRSAARCAALLLLAPLGACATLPRAAAPRLEQRLTTLFADTAFAGAHWGILVQDARSGKAIYQRNPDQLFLPASNEKLLTSAAALEALGPDYRYRTRFLAGGPVRDGVLQGPLVVRGSGDPTLSSRFYPDARAALRAWADSLRAHGVTRIAGGIVGVDSAFAGPPLGAGWAWDDLDAYYAAEFGALEFNEGVVDLQVIPGRAVGDPGIVVVDPPTQYVRIDNRTATAAAGTPARLSFTREPQGPGIEVAGVVPADTPSITETLAVRGPAGFFLTVLRETLRESGIAVEGPALPAEEWPMPRQPLQEWTLFTYTSPPLREILPAMLKPSQNWIAETLLHTLGWELRGEGSARAGVAVVDSLLGLWGLQPVARMRMVDGSGLSRYDLVTPRLLVGLLQHMAASPDSALWYAALPVAGEDGTLKSRMSQPPLLGRVHAKTGTLTGVRSLSGYLTTTRGEPIVFSFLVNHHLHHAADVDRLVDEALREIAEETGVG